MGKKDSTVTQKTDNSPWKPAQGALKGILREGGDIYGGLGDPNRFVPQIQQAIAPAQQVASGQSAIGTGADYQGLLDRAMQPGGGEATLAQMAGGPVINPHFQAMLDDQLGRLGDQVNRGISAAGRYGSGAHAGVLTDRLGDAATSALGQEWARATGQQLSAAQALEQAQQGRLGLQGSAIQGMTGTEAQNIANSLIGGQQSLAGIQALQGAPWSDLRQWLGIAGPVGGMGSQGGGTTTTSNPGAGLGTGLALASFL